MAIKTITRNDIGNAVYREMGLSRKESLEIVENIIQKNIAPNIQIIIEFPFYVG